MCSRKCAKPYRFQGLSIDPMFTEIDAEFIWASGSEIKITYINQLLVSGCLKLDFGRILGRLEKSIGIYQCPQMNYCFFLASSSLY